MSLKSLYSISELNINENEFSARITFDPSHEIFSGHFPDQSVVPGVCLIHIVKEIAINIAGREVLLSNGSNIKFLKVINPRENLVVSIMGSYSMNENHRLSLNANILKEAIVFFKFKGTFKTSLPK